LSNCRCASGNLNENHSATKELSARRGIFLLQQAAGNIGNGLKNEILSIVATPPTA
jgi:hypothetical protein